MNIHEDDDPRPTSSVSLVIMHLNILLYITQSVQGEFFKNYNFEGCNMFPLLFNWQTKERGSMAVKWKN